MTPSLSSPLRVTWDFPQKPEYAAALWDRLVEARVFFVEIFLTHDSIAGLEGLAAGVKALGSPKITFIGEADVLSRAAELFGEIISQCAELMVLPDYGSLEALEFLASRVSNMTMAVWSTPDGMESFPRAVELSSCLGLKSTAALNPHHPADFLLEEHHSKAAEAWKTLSSPGLDARIHDLFLSEALGKDPFAAYAGCQAGSALAHLSSDGKLVACRTLPVQLGDLSVSTVRDVWSSSVRTELAASLKEPPVDCAGCAIAQVCLGGCRGLDSQQGRDPSCTAKRTPVKAS